MKRFALILCALFVCALPAAAWQAQQDVMVCPQQATVTYAVPAQQQVVVQRQFVQVPVQRQVIVQQAPVVQRVVVRQREVEVYPAASTTTIKQKRGLFGRQKTVIKQQ